MEERQAQGEQGLLSKQVTAELAAIGQQRIQDFVSAQAELLNQLRKLNEIWLDRLRSEAAAWPIPEMPTSPPGSNAPRLILP